MNNKRFHKKNFYKIYKSKYCLFFFNHINLDTYIKKAYTATAKSFNEYDGECASSRNITESVNAITYCSFMDSTEWNKLRGCEYFSVGTMHNDVNIWTHPLTL